MMVMYWGVLWGGRSQARRFWSTKSREPLPTFRGVLESAVDDGLHDLRLEEEVPEASGVDTHIGALLEVLLVGVALGDGGRDFVFVVNKVVGHL